MKGVIFDVDGVIVDVRESYHYAIKHTAERFLGIEVSVEEVRHIKFSKGINNDYLATREVIRHFGKDANIEEIIEVFNEIYKKLRDKEKLILSKEFFLELKSKGYPLGILTGRPREDLEYTFNKFSLFDCFDFIVDDDTIPMEELRKPHPFALHFCIEGMSLDACVYVGDSRADWEMVEGYKKMYEKPVRYIHFGENISIEGIKTVKTPQELSLALQEALRLL